MRGVVAAVWCRIRRVHTGVWGTMARYPPVAPSRARNSIAETARDNARGMREEARSRAGTRANRRRPSLSRQLRFRSLRSNRLVRISWRVFLTPCNALFLNAWELMAATLHAYSFDGITPITTTFYCIGAHETETTLTSIISSLAILA